MLGGIEAMDHGLAARITNFDLLRAMSLYALDRKDQSLVHLNREIENHDNPAAREFLRDFFELGIKAGVQQWCADRGNAFDLSMTDTERVNDAVAAVEKS